MEGEDWKTWESREGVLQYCRFVRRGSKLSELQIERSQEKNEIVL